MITAVLLTALLSSSPTEMMIPEGTVLPIVLNEKISTAKIQDNDPILFTLADDVRSGGRRGPILIPRGSNVVGRAVKVARAGHFVGKSDLSIQIQEIVTPEGEVYDGLSTKIVDVGRTKGEKGEVKANGEIQGPSHAKRDAFLLLFPPTTVFQLMAIPMRGPDIVLPVETRLYVKLMNPIYAEPAEAAMASPTRLQAAPTAQAAQIPQYAPAPQTAQIPQYAPVPQSYAGPRVSPGGIEVLVTPVALYPDDVLRQVFVACMYPLQIVQADQWLQQSRNATGAYLGGRYPANWNASVQALTAYPDLLRRLSANISWTTSLGNAYRAQQADVFSAVQRLRAQANAGRRLGMY